MTNKTLATGITVTGIVAILLTQTPDSELMSLFALAFFVFAFMGAYRLNKI